MFCTLIIYMQALKLLQKAKKPGVKMITNSQPVVMKKALRRQSDDEDDADEELDELLDLQNRIK